MANNQYNAHYNKQIRLHTLSQKKKPKQQQLHTKHNTDKGVIPPKRVKPTRIQLESDATHENPKTRPLTEPEKKIQNKRTTSAPTARPKCLVNKRGDKSVRASLPGGGGRRLTWGRGAAASRAGAGARGAGTGDITRYVTG